MMQLEFGGRRYEIPARELAVGSDPACDVVLTGTEVKPRHAVLRGTTEGSAIIQRASPDADTLVNGVKLAAEPAPVLHGDRIQINGHELLVVDSRKSGSTQFLDASAIAAMASSPAAPSRTGGPAPVKGGRLVCLTDGREYTISGTLVFGREAGNDVVVESTQVSRRHAEIEATPEGYLLSDLSTNGTFVNGQRIQGKRTLARADMIRIADYEFRFYADVAPVPPPPAPPAAAVAPPPAPVHDVPPPRASISPLSHPMSSGPVTPPAGAAQRLNDTLHGQSFSKRGSPGNSESAPSAPAPMASFLVRSGKLKGSRLPIRVPVANIGRADYNDIVVADDSVSTAHAKLQRREGVWVLVDLGSTNGTFVDGEPVTGEVPLGPGVTVRFGQVSVLFEPTDDSLGVAKGSGTRMMEPIKVPDAAPSPPPPPAAPTPRSAPPPIARGPRESPARPAQRRPPVVVTPPPRNSTAKWLIPAVIVVALGAIIFFLLRR
jgi:pSer/pThr/pTyr-binding forkhead associated (FHA) protein